MTQAASIGESRAFVMAAMKWPALAGVCMSFTTVTGMTCEGRQFKKATCRSVEATDLSSFEVSSGCW